MSYSTGSSVVTIKGRPVRVDPQGRVSLNDIHQAGGFSKNYKPSDWGALASTRDLIAITAQKSSGKSGTLSKNDVLSVYCVKMGRGGGIWAHPNLALAYAKYLSPALHYEVNEVFLRYKAADATLADDVLARGTKEDNEWAGVRALSRSKRTEYTKTLQDHGVAGSGYGSCTNAIYVGLFDKDANSLKKAKGLKPSANLRDKMSTDELVFTMAAETLAKNRIDYEDARGNEECRKASRRSAGYIKKAIDANRADSERQDRLPGT